MYTSASALLLKTAMQSFWNTYYTIADPFDGLVDVQQSTQETETRAFLGAAPMPEEWISDDNVKAANEYSYTAKNKAWKGGVRIPKNLIKFQQWDEIGRHVANLGEKARAHRTKKLSEMLNTGTVATGADDDPFFDTAHEWEGAEYTTAQNNDLTSVAADADFPTDLEFAAALRGMFDAFWSFKDDRGDPMTPNSDSPENFICMVPPKYRSIALRVMRADSLTGPLGSDLKGLFTVRVNPFLTAPTTTGKFYLCYSGSNHKPLILQEAGGLQFGDNLQGEEYRSRGSAVFDASWWGETIYGNYVTAVLHTFTE